MAFDHPQDRLAVALDVTGRDDALRLVDTLDDTVGILKVGHQLAYSGGFNLIAELASSGRTVFADLKLLDIDQTVAHGVQSVAATGAAYLTVHAYPRAMRAGVQALRGDVSLKLLGVTVLTSMDDEDLQEAGYAVPADQLVMTRALQAKQIGLPGLVCSAREVKAIRAVLGDDRLLVTPGIRFAGDEVGDQKRVVTPAKAIADGADILVMGRPITAADDPKSAARRAAEEIEDGLRQRNSPVAP